MKRIIIIIFILLCISVKADELKSDSLITGIWIYNGCTIKNTSVTGTAEFKSDGTLILKIIARDDYPVKNNLSGTYKYTVSGNKIKTDYKGGYGIAEFFLIDGDRLYFSGIPMNQVFDDTEKKLFNWSYRLRRGKL